MRPNLLLVVFDTARLDAFEPYGAPPGATPTVAQIASLGSAHPRAYSTGCWTVPGHGSMWTGLLPRSAGLGHAGMRYKEFPAALEAFQDRLLPEVLRRAGYETAGISTNTWISSRFGFSKGFDRYLQVRSHRAPGIRAINWRERASWYLQALRARCDDGAGEVERTLDDWLARRGEQPFFWFVNLMECHSPYLPPKPYNSLGAVDRVRSAAEASRHLALDNIWRCACGGFDVPGPAVDRMRRLYADSIRQLDGWLARVLEMLDRHGVLDETQVVVTSDHGENLGENDLLTHVFSLDDRLLRVPLVTAGPEDLSGDGLLSLADLPRVLAGVAGLDEHPWDERATGDGVVVAEFDAPGEPGDERLRGIADRWGLGDEAVRVLSTSFTCATDGELKLLRRAGREEVVDLALDPLEERPLPVSPAVQERYRDRLAPLRAALDRAQAMEREPAPAVQPEADPEENARLEAQLRQLGYL